MHLLIYNREVTRDAIWTSCIQKVFIPFRWNSICILFICNLYLSEQLPNFQLNFEVQIHVLKETLWYPYACMLKHWYMRKPQLFVITYYLQISWHNMNLILTLGKLLYNLSWSMMLLTWSCHFSCKYVLVFKLYSVLFTKFVMSKVLSFIAFVEVDISNNKLRIWKTFRRSYMTRTYVICHISDDTWPIYQGLFPVKFIIDLMPKNL